MYNKHDGASSSQHHDRCYVAQKTNKQVVLHLLLLVLWMSPQWLQTVEASSVAKQSLQAWKGLKSSSSSSTSQIYVSRQAARRALHRMTVSRRAHASSNFRVFSQRANLVGQQALQSKARLVHLKILAEDLSSIFTNHPDASVIDSHQWLLRRHESLGSPHNPHSHRNNVVAQVVRGIGEIVTESMGECVSGFLGGYALAMATHGPARLLSVLQGQATQPPPPYPLPTMLFRPNVMLNNQMLQEGIRMQQRAIHWACDWAMAATVFGACRTTVKVLRRNKDDDNDDPWDTILGSALAGAVFNRGQSAQAILRGAALYGGTMYLLSYGGYWLAQQETSMQDFCDELEQVRDLL